MTSAMFSFSDLLLLLLSSQNSASPVPRKEGSIAELCGSMEPHLRAPLKPTETNHASVPSISQMVPSISEMVLNNNPKQKMLSPVNEPKGPSSAHDETRNNNNQSPSTTTSSYLSPKLSPNSITTRPKSLLKVNPKFTYFTFDKNTQLPTYALGSSQQIQQLKGDAPMFTVAADNIIYREDTDAIAFIRRAHHNKDGAPLPYGGRLAYPAGFFDFTDGSNSDSNTNHQGTDFISNQALVNKMQQGALRELKEEAPELLKLVQDAHTQTLFQGFASSPDRDVRYQLMPDYLPTTSAVFFTTLKKGPNFAISGADDAAGHRLVWVQRKTLLSLAKQYSSKVHQETYKAIDKQYNEEMEFTVQDFAFDHLKLAEAVFSRHN